MININPMDNVEMIKKSNFLSVQGKEDLSEGETVTVFDEDEFKRFKAEVVSTYEGGTENLSINL